MAIMTHATFNFNQLMLTLIFGIRSSEPPPGPDERLKRPGLIGLICVRKRCSLANLLCDAEKFSANP